MDNVRRTSGWNRRWPSLNPVSSAGGRIISGFALLVVILAAVAFGSAWRMHKHHSVTAAMEERADTAFLIQDALVNVETAASALQRYITVGDETLVAGDEALIAEIRSFTAAGMDAILQATAQEEKRGDELEATRLRLISSQAASLIEGVEQIIELRRSGSAQEAATALEGTVFPFRLFEDSLKEAAEYQAAELSDLRDRADRAGDIALWALVISGAAGAVLGLTASGLIARSIIKPLSSLEATAVAVSNGDLEARAQAAGPRELARLGTSLNTMTESLLDASKRRELEEEIRRHDQYFRSLIENAADVVMVLNDDATVRYASPSVRQSFGLGPEDLIGSSALRGIVHPDDLPSTLATFARAAQNPHVTESLAARIRHADGSWRALEGTLRNLRDDPAVAGLVLNCRDVTDRKRSEDALARYKLLFSKANDLAYICDAEGDILYVNEVFERLSGHRPEEFIGKSFAPLFDEENLAIAIENYERTLRGGTSQYEVAFKDTGVLCEYTNLPYRDDTGAIVGVFGIARDITERRRAEEALQESERLLLESQSVAQVGSYVLDITAGAWESSPVLDRIFGIGEGYERSVEGWLALVHPDVRQSMADYFAHDVIEERGRFDTEYRIVRHDDGIERWVLGLGKLEFDARGRPLRMVGTIQDITERRQVEEALAQASRQNELILNSAVEGIYGLDLDGNTTFINPAAAKMTGWEPEELIGKPQHVILHHSRADGSPYPRDECPIYAAFNHGTTAHLESEVFWRKDGTSFPVEYASTPILDEHGELSGAVVSFSDITERKQAEETIRHMAYHDALTKLPNRALFQDRLKIALAQARRRERLLAVLYLDLDRFKAVNDSVGHEAGDELLRIVGERLSAVVRDGDSAARVGGDEFTLLLSEVDGEEDAVRVAERTLETFRRPFLVGGHTFHVTTSIGIALFPSDGENAESLLRNADEAMYRAKDSGGDSYLLCTTAMNAGITERLAVEEGLRRGLERQEFIVYYQPQVEIDTGRVTGTEALVRWQHPERGLTLPADFISVAEDTGIIVPLGEWVLRTACAQAGAWQEAGLPPMRMAVNLSARQFQQRNLVEVVSGALRDGRLAPRYLQLEITEGSAMQDAEFAIAMLTDLRKMGVQVSIDDFGTGYSSLNYLKRFPINALKIDRSFVRDLTTDAHDAAIASTIIAMAHALKLTVVAEGVETEEQLTFLKKRRCNEFQGYHCAKPLPVDKLEELLRERAPTGVSPS